MGRDERTERRKAQRSGKFLNGRMSVEEFHAKHSFSPDARCAGCKKPHPTVRAIVMVPVDELKRRDPAMMLLSEVDPAGFLKLVVNLKIGPHIRVSTTYSCRLCRSEFEKALAKAPSWAVVEITDGPPDQNKVVVAV